MLICVSPFPFTSHLNQPSMKTPSPTQIPSYFFHFHPFAGFCFNSMDWWISSCLKNYFFLKKACITCSQYDLITKRAEHLLAWYDWLSRDTVSPVIDDNSAQCVQALDVSTCVRLHTLKITSLLYITSLAVQLGKIIPNCWAYKFGHVIIDRADRIQSRSQNTCCFKVYDEDLWPRSCRSE